VDSSCNPQFSTVLASKLASFQQTQGSEVDCLLPNNREWFFQACQDVQVNFLVDSQASKAGAVLLIPVHNFHPMPSDLVVKVSQLGRSKVVQVLCRTVSVTHKLLLRYKPRLAAAGAVEDRFLECKAYHQTCRPCVVLALRVLDKLVACLCNQRTWVDLAKVVADRVFLRFHHSH
jgi:hypothetical protein